MDHSFVSSNMNKRTQWSSCQSIRVIDYDESFLDSSSSLDVKSDDTRTPQWEYTSSSFRTFSLGRISLLILILATLADQAIVQIYHHSSSPTTTSSSVQFSLGSAAISTVTEKLSPILPFAGGMDFRRDDYWSTGSWLDSVQSIFTSVQDAYQRKQQPSNKPKKQIKKKTHRTMVLSAPKPFVSVDAISELTLGDVGDLFRWAAHHRSSARISKMIASTERAIHTSVGFQAEEGEPLNALKFIAAMRIFAEWRIVRQVPEGYKGFAVGMSLGHKDVVQNLVKMEEAIHQWLDDHPEASTPPTLRELLEWEIETGVNPKSNLPRLKEKSAGIGLLWVRRQLAYQTRIFDNVVHSDRFPSMKDAVSDAYKAVYNQYHGWAVQKIFNYSFQAAPDATEILRHMNPHKLREVLANAPSLNESSEVLHQNPVQAFFQHIGEEWDKLRGAKPTVASSKENKATHDEYVTRAMVKDAHYQIALYLEAAAPVLEHLSDLFADLNMNDPSRV